MKEQRVGVSCMAGLRENGLYEVTIRITNLKEHQYRQVAEELRVPLQSALTTALEIAGAKEVQHTTERVH